MDTLEKIIEEYKSRTIFGHPIRWTTLRFHRHKVTFEEFINSLGYQKAYFQGEKYPEEWCELWMAFNEIEERRGEEDITDHTILCLAEEEEKYRAFVKEQGLE